MTTECAYSAIQKTNESISTIPDAHSDFVKSLHMFPTLGLLISGSSDNIVRFWLVSIEGVCDRCTADKLLLGTCLSLTAQNHGKALDRSHPTRGQLSVLMVKRSQLILRFCILETRWASLKYGSCRKTPVTDMHDGLRL